MIKVYAKVGFDGTDAPLRSDKGSSRIPVTNWFRGTICIVAAKVEYVKDGVNFSPLVWKEEKPNSNKTNIPLIIVRGDENNEATCALCIGLYDEELSEIEKDIFMIGCERNGDHRSEKVIFECYLLKDEKLARKCHGLAGAGSAYLCTYCDVLRNKIREEDVSGSISVTKSNELEKEAAAYCLLNPGKKSQETLSKYSHGIRSEPFVSSQPFKEPPDSLHLDINITTHLVTIATRIYHFADSQNYIYEKRDSMRKEMESSEEKFFSELRKSITTLPEITSFPGNFVREFCDLKNKEVIEGILPDVPEAKKWINLLTTWRKIREIHKSNHNPNHEVISHYKDLVENFTRIYNDMTWVTYANQVHRLSHVAWFMETYEVSAIGALSLEGLEHGNYSTKLLENTRIFNGSSKKSLKQLFRKLRQTTSSKIRRTIVKQEKTKVKPMCGACKQKGHKRNHRVCTNYGQDLFVCQENIVNREREIEDVENGQDEDSNNEYETIGEVNSRDDPVSSEDSDN